MCGDIPCIKVCPSSASDREIEPTDDSCVGLVVLLGHENCSSYQGPRCDVYHYECPEIDEAIVLELDRNMCTDKHARSISTVYSDARTGCGKYEKICVLEQSVIKVLPSSLVKGESGHHYRFGWLEGDNDKPQT